MPCYQLAHLNFSLSGSGPVYDYLKSEFRCLPESQSEPELRLSIVGTLPQPPESSITARMITGWQEGFQCQGNGMSYQVVQNGSTVDIDIAINESIIARSKGWKSAVSRFRDWNFLTPAETIAKNIMYSVFNMFSAISLVQSGKACYLHASSFAKNGKGVAIVASGGAGKTTSLLKLVTEHGWSYLSDDLCLLDIDGNIWRTPLRMQIYAYNCINQPQLSSLLLDNRSFLDRLSWNMTLYRRGPERVRRRISAESYFGKSNVAVNASLKHVFFLERSHIETYKVTTLSLNDLIRRVQLIMPDEVGPLISTSAALSLVSCLNLLPTIGEFNDQIQTILTQALSGITPVLVQVPIHSGPDELMDIIQSVISSG
jgi:hypothetical protein